MESLLLGLSCKSPPEHYWEQVLTGSQSGHGIAVRENDLNSATAGWGGLHYRLAVISSLLVVSAERPGAESVLERGSWAGISEAVSSCLAEMTGGGEIESFSLVTVSLGPLLQMGDLFPQSCQCFTFHHHEAHIKKRSMFLIVLFR